MPPPPDPPPPPAVPPNPPALEDPQLAAAAARQGQYERMTHNLSLGLLFLCPAIVAMPPRKLDFYTFSLAGAWVLSANHLWQERRTTAARRMPLEQRVQAQKGGAWGDSLPTERAREVQRALRERKERALREGPGVGEEKEVEGGDDRGLLKRVWMGDEKEGWKERRLQEEREAVAEGRGYGSMIMDQVREVWSGKSDDGSGQSEKEK